MKYIIVENGQIRQLQVINVSAADEGLYTCTVQNKESVAKLLVARMLVAHAYFALFACLVLICQQLTVYGGVGG